jgi:hypothetical protein
MLLSSLQRVKLAPKVGVRHVCMFEGSVTTCICAEINNQIGGPYECTDIIRADFNQCFVERSKEKTSTITYLFRKYFLLISDKLLFGDVHFFGGQLSVVLCHHVKTSFLLHISTRFFSDNTRVFYRSHMGLCVYQKT